MNWTWSLVEGAWHLAPDPLPRGLRRLAFRGRELGAASSLTRPAVSLEQVHGTTVRWAETAGSLPSCDAVRTRTPGLLVSVRTADCLPVFLGHPDEGLALVHAGWRGLVDGVLEATVATFDHPGRIVALIGPAIGVCCFEVGPEVAQRFERTRHPRPGGKPHVDLAAEAAARLVRAGLSPSHVHRSGVCTRCHQHLLHSHRGSGGAPGRIVTLAALA